MPNTADEVYARLRRRNQRATKPSKTKADRFAEGKAAKRRKRKKMADAVGQTVAKNTKNKAMGDAAAGGFEVMMGAMNRAARKGKK